ncbi:TetR/AcrR family transcriptional regulator [Actinoplanes sp. L3-i22]|uniref:TetR/AcrR family transcriptional regulator n=1 Tax=Actinoplanes sp. L3-i22 TaxID=2836373 RepID=UPI001C74EF11|nr:TetR/AcrR family transcriptional regulator [Actinoplanes sp. L3-i22]BCY09151.1 TetR family transcriptional regulator [Actinoplanes sp. L3-i22]
MARPRAFDEQSVLDAAVRQFRTGGYAGTSLDDISAATGVGRGSLYASFGDKHTVFIKALHEYVRQALIQTHDELDGPDESAIDRLHTWILAGAGFVLRDDEHFGCMAGKFALEVGDRDTEAHDVILDVFSQQQRALADCVAAAQRHGDLAPDADGCAIACLVLALNRGMDVMAKGGIGQDVLDAAAEQAFRGLPLTDAYRQAARR